MLDPFIVPLKSPLEELEDSSIRMAANHGQSSNRSDAEQSISETPRQLDFTLPQEVDNTNRHFKGQQKNEVLLCFCRKHWIVLLPHFLGLLVVLIGLLGFTLFMRPAGIRASLSADTYQIIAAFLILALTFYLHRAFLRFINYFLQTLIITSFRVIQLDQTLYFNHDRDSIDLPEIQDIEVRRNGLIKTLLNYGEINITLSSAASTKMLHCIPNPEYYFRKINKTKREYITSRRFQKGPPPSQTNTI